MTNVPPVPFPGSAYQEIHAALVRSLARRDGLVVLIGESGVGKTTLWQSVVDDTGATSSAVLNPFVEFPDLLRQIVADFGLETATDQPKASEHELIRTIQHFVEQAGRPVILIVDDAHLMSRHVLGQMRALINLSTNVGGLTVLLAGQPPLENALRRREFRGIEERIAHRWLLGPLTRTEVPAYLAHRFADVEPPRDDVMDALAEMSEGVPAVLDRVVDAALVPGASTTGRLVDAAAIREAAAFIRAETTSARRRAILSTVGVGFASACLAVSWLGATPWRRDAAAIDHAAAPPVIAPSTRLSGLLTADPTTDLADVRERLSPYIADLAARGNVTALLDLRADIIARSRDLGTTRVTALLRDVDARLSEARVERLRLDGEMFNRESMQ